MKCPAVMARQAADITATTCLNITGLRIPLWLEPTARQIAPIKLSGAFWAFADKTPELTQDRALISEVLLALWVI